MSERLYVYGLMRPGDPAPALTSPAVAAPAAAIETRSAGGLVALVSAIDLVEIPSTRRHMLAHTRVLEEAMGAGPVLPARFGIIAPSLEALDRAIGPQQEKLSRLFARIEGRAEYGVRVTWSREAAMREVVEQTPGLAQRHAAIRAKPEAATYYERIDLGRDVAEALSAKRSLEENALFARMAEVACDRVLQAPEDDVQVLKADLLVRREREGELAALLERLEAEQPGRLAIRLVGPAPAYNFVKVRLEFAGPERQAA